MKPITGSWFDFRHPSSYDGNYWNDQTAHFSADQWGAKIGEMTGLGMDTLVLMSVAVGGKAFYDSKVMKNRLELACLDPLEAVLSASDRLKTNVYLGVGFFQENTGEVGGDDQVQRLNREVPRELADRYGHHPSFYGWYLPVEERIDGHYSEAFMEYANTLSRICRGAAKKKVLIAPYGTRHVLPDSKFVSQLKNLETDFIAYQDEVGVEKTQVEELETIYSNLKKVHEQAGIPLWADMEIFKFEGKVYKSPLLPASFERIKSQLEILSRYCEKILCYQYLGLMNPPDSQAMAGHPSSTKLYEDYTRWLGTKKK